MSQLTNLHSKDDGELLHIYCDNFFHKTSKERVNLTEPSWNIQISSMKFSENRLVEPHRHLLMNREISQSLSHEVWLVTGGEFTITFFDKDCKTIIDAVQAKTGFISISLFGLHSIKAVSEGSTFLEIKNGPYVGKDIEYLSENQLKTSTK